MTEIIEDVVEPIITIDEPDIEPEETDENATAIADLFDKDYYKPLELRTVVNKILRDLDAKELPGPMFYTYCEKGYIKAESGDGTRGNKFRISKEAAIVWTESYIARRFSA